MMIHGAAVMGLADGPTEVHKITVARQVVRDYRPSDDMWPTEWIPRKIDAARAKFAELLETGGRKPVIDLEKLAAWMDDEGLPGKGEPIEHRYISGGSQNEIYEIRRGELHGCVIRIPPPTAPASRDDGILREWRIIEALDGTDVPHTRGDRGVQGRVACSAAPST